MRNLALILASIIVGCCIQYGYHEMRRMEFEEVDRKGYFSYGNRYTVYTEKHGDVTIVLCMDHATRQVTFGFK